MSEKNVDRTGRIRNKCIAFRVSEAEKEIIDRKFKLSGFSVKQEYLIARNIYESPWESEDFSVNGNTFYYQNLHNEIDYFINLLKDFHEEYLKNGEIGSHIVISKKEKNDNEVVMFYSDLEILDKIISEIRHQKLNFELNSFSTDREKRRKKQRKK